MTESRPTKDDTRLLAKVREPPLVFDAYESDQGVDDLYADGFLGMWGDASITKMGFYKTVQPVMENDTPIEQRMLFARITMPTRNLVDMCLKVVKRAAVDKEVLGLQDLFEDVTVEFTSEADEKSTAQGKVNDG